MFRRNSSIPAFWASPFFDSDLIDNMILRSQKGANSSRVFPAINITEDKDSYYIRAELPGLSTDEINLEISDRKLSISGEKLSTHQDEGIKYHRKERDYGKFSRVITLPKDIDSENIDAKMVNGILAVRIGKSEIAKPKQISISSQ